MDLILRDILTPEETEAAGRLLAGQGLELPERREYGVAAYAGERVAAAGWRGGSTLMGLCVDPAWRGEGVSLRIVDRLIKEAAEHGLGKLFLFTTPKESATFLAMGFRLVASAPEHAALLEWGFPSFEEWLAGMAPSEPAPGPVGFAALNANPFTLGHRHLLETAAACCATLYVFVVQEDVSAFPFAARLRLAQEGMAHLPACRVLPGGPYVISLHTFPAYFSEAEEHGAHHAALDLHLFGQRIAPALGVSRRFVGTEPASAVTAAYNEAMRAILPAYGVAVQEVPRLEAGGAIISASRLRAALAAGDMDEALRHAPASTAAFLQSEEGGRIIAMLRKEIA
jgi:[citrate (pro-3S)-lyase] ligase